MSVWSAQKRLLALDGGGTAGIVSIAFLERIESILKEASGGRDDFRLADHFHFVGGTSTGAVIAAALATGRTVTEIKGLYFDLASRVFRRDWLRLPYIRPRFASRPLAEALAIELGDITLDDPKIRTKLAIIIKRIDTGSPWIVSNLPDQPYWDDRPDGDYLGNRHYKLATIVRASTAAPFFFGPEAISIAADQDLGVFIDGGISPYNSPVLPLLMLATLRRYGLCWPLGPENLSMISIGTGRYRHKVQPRSFYPAVLFATETLAGMVEDSQATSLMLMQWLSESEAPWFLNSEIQDLRGELLGGRPLLSFQRYDLWLEQDWLRDHLGEDVSTSTLRRLRRIDDPFTMPELYSLAVKVAESQVKL